MRTLIVLLALAASAAGAEDGPYPLTIEAGKTVAVCKTNTIACPAASPICDDTSVVDARFGAEGLIFKALKPGKTLCSAAANGGGGPRRLYAITVVP
jgi:hypothetical protein